MTDKNAAAPSREWLEAAPLILEPETMGLGDDAKIVEFTAIDRHGRAVVIDTLIRPNKPIPKAAVDIMASPIPLLPPRRDGGTYTTPLAWHCAAGPW